MNKESKQIIVIAEDDIADYILLEDACTDEKLTDEFILHRVTDGNELKNYLLRDGNYKELENSSQPVLIILDLNMPNKGGKEFLKELPAHKEFQKIPIVIFTTSNMEEDEQYCCSHGAKLYLRKPDKYSDLKKIVCELRKKCLRKTA